MNPKPQKVISLIVTFTFLLMIFTPNIAFAEETLKVPVKVNNTELNSNKNLKGATFKIVKGTNVDSPPIEGLEWVSDGDIKEFKLPPGTYTLVQTIAPKGYEKATPITFNIASNGNIENNTKFTSFSEEEGLFTEAIFLKNASEEEEPKIVYCFNISKMTPPLKTSSSKVSYSELLGNANVFASNATKPKFTDERLVNSVLRMIYNGYPNDALNIKEKFNLKDSQFRDITQRAIWNFTDSNFSKYKLSKNEAQALDYLVATDNPIPDNLVLNLYIPDSKYSGYQNLLSTEFVKPSLITITNKKDPNKPTLPEVKEGKLKTTVTADGKEASKEEIASVDFESSKDGVDVKDTVTYEGLVGEEEYTLTGTLVHIKADGSIEEVATATDTLKADKSGNGTWTLDFGNQKLEVGEKYVVFEKAESVNNLIDTDNNYELDTKQVVKHENKEDKAQSFILKEDKNPAEKITPEKITPNNDQTNNSAGNSNYTPSNSNKKINTSLILPKTGEEIATFAISLLGFVLLLIATFLKLKSRKITK